MRILRRSSRRVRLPGVAVLAAAIGCSLAAALLTLAGCGDLPLFPGALTVSPGELTVEENSQVVLTRTGGYPPIDFALAPDSPAGGSLAPDAGGYSVEYTAPSVPAVGTLSVTITATDLDRESVSVLVTVFETFSIDPADAVLPVGGTLDLSVAGGIPQYTYEVASGPGGIVPSGPTAAASATYTAGAGPGEVLIRASDSLGNTVEAVITLVEGSDLLLSPATASVAIGGTQSFVIYGGTPPYGTPTVDPPGTGTILVTGPTTFDYTAPGTPGEVVEILVEDSGLGVATAEVTIVAAPLTLSPSTITTGFDEQSVFTAVGGTSPYTWSVEGVGTIESIDDSHAVYTAPSTARTDWVKVTDAKEKFRKAKVYVVQ